MRTSQASFIAAAVACCLTHPSAMAADALIEGFRTPPQAARPRVWWHWMNGNITEEGVKLDLEWMKRMGIGGVHNFDAAFNWGGPFDTPSQVARQLTYLTPEWRRIMRYSVALADAWGLEFTIASSPGFSETGGPWVQPGQAMKKLVWSETHLRGGKPFAGRLANPPRTTGSFQNIASVPIGSKGIEASNSPAYYADVATIAYRMPSSELPPGGLRPTVTSSAGAIDASLLSDGDLAKAVSLPFAKDGQEWIELSFAKPQRMQALTAVIGRPLGFDPLLESNPGGSLEASVDGRTFRKIIDLPENGAMRSSAIQQTVSFAPVVARVFRVALKRPTGPGPAEQLGLSPAPAAHQVAELVLHTAARVNRFEDKAGYSSRPILEADDTPDVAAGDSVRQQDVIDLTNRMRADGSLDWTPPAGRWTVLRFGYSLTGRTNHPASPAGTGLEVDKLNRRHVKSYVDAYLGEYEKTLSTDLIGRRGLQYLMTDSYEAGPQNWTDDMLEQFKQRRGYEALPWLPVLAGRVIESAAASDRFLWDFRQTLGDLIAEAHYAQLSASLHERGLGRYGESHEHLRAFVGDGMKVKKTASVPMGAMWAASPPGVGFTRESMDADIRESASVAHLYGQNLVAAESFTAFGNPYGFSPEDLKPIADREMAMGLNRFVIHTSPHQPDSKPGPGIGLGPFGQWFTRKETWANQAGGWIAYLARSSFLLQQGRFVADIAYLYGEDTNLTARFDTGAPSIPEGYGFDFINADALLNELSVRDGILATRSGMRYRVLVLDESTRRMSLPVLRGIRDLVRAGATVKGPKPTGTPSLADDASEFNALAAELWDGKRIEPLRDMPVPPDVVFSPTVQAPPRFVHRALKEGDLYFLSSADAQALSLEVSFRVSGRKPELWRADTGEITPLSYRMEQGRTIVPLQLEPNDAVFVVFREPAAEPKVIVRERATRVLATLDGPWEVSFPPDLGAPARVRFESLQSWTDSAEAGVKYFSGTATYSKTIAIPRRWLGNRARVRLDLGRVKNVAEVLVNGRPMGVVWKAPFTLDVTGALKPGDNRLEIQVSNLWPNRLIGDKQPGARKIAFATFDPFEAGSPLLPSGLLGPVTLTKEAHDDR